MARMDPELAAALDGARAAPRQTRIEWRSAISAHGVAGIDAVRPWLADPELAAFAVTVVEEAGRNGAADAAIRALRAAVAGAPSPGIVRMTDEALARLGAVRTPVSKPAVRRPPAPEAGIAWPGFAERDFGNVAGTSWRSRTAAVSLAPRLLASLLMVDERFQSWSVSRSPELQLALEDRFHQVDEHQQAWRASKLVVYAHGPNAERPDDVARVTAGWYIEKGTGSDEYGPVSESLWDWPLLRDLLADPAARTGLAAATERHGLRIGDYTGGRFMPDGARCGFIARIEDGELVVRAEPGGAVIGRGWDALASTVAALPEGTWHDLHIWTEWPAAEAIAAGPSFASTALEPVLTDLARVYVAMVG